MIKSNISLMTTEQNFSALFMNVIKKSAIPVFKQESEMLANKMVKDIKFRLRKQLFRHTPLNVKYKMKKQKFGYDTRILFASGQYYRSICVIPTEYGARIGLKDIEHYPNPMRADWKRQQDNFRRRRKYIPRPGSKVKRNLSARQINMIALAKILEYGGTRPKIGEGGPGHGAWHMPPRPHWRPVIAKFKREQNIIKKNFTDKMKAAIKVALANELRQARIRKTRDNTGYS